MSKRKILFLILITLAIATLAAGTLMYLKKQNNFDNQILGYWSPTEETREESIFNNNIKIVYTRTRPGSISSRMLIIYDSDMHGLLCGEDTNKESFFACTAVEINKKEITADDRADLVNNGAYDLPPLYINLKLANDTLTIEGFSLFDLECAQNPRPECFNPFGTFRPAESF